MSRHKSIDRCDECGKEDSLVYSMSAFVSDPKHHWYSYAPAYCYKCVEQYQKEEKIKEETKKRVKHIEELRNEIDKIDDIELQARITSLLDKLLD